MVITGTHDGPVTAVQAYRDKARLVRDPQLPHLMDVNQFFVELAVYARTHPPTTDLRTWWSPFISRRIAASQRHKLWHGETCTTTAASSSGSNPTTGPSAPPPSPRTSTGYHSIAARTERPDLRERKSEPPRRRYAKRR